MYFKGLLRKKLIEVAKGEFRKPESDPSETDFWITEVKIDRLL